MIAAVVLALACQAAPEKETVKIPGTKVSFELVKIADAPGLRPYSIGVREVTWGELKLYSEPGPKAAVDAVTRPSDALSYFGEVVPQESRAADMPATNARWHTAVQYCAWLSKKTGRYFRLPTESEWEYAARAGEKGAGPEKSGDVAWHAGNAKKITHPGGQKKPNAFGLYDTLGNVWEYCLEFDAPPVYGPVLRGGCFATASDEITYGSRRLIPQNWFQDDCVRPRSVWWLGSDKIHQGFRVVCVGEDADAKERDAYAGRIEVQVAFEKDNVDVKVEKATPDEFCIVKGRVRNGGDRTLDEVEIAVHYLTPDGQPHWRDNESPKPHRASFSRCWPVLPNGVRAEGDRKPLKPGETRPFVIYLPSTFAPDTEVDRKKFGAMVTNLRFAKE
jgi:formylglycine-generating enzyme required for sulfatase activity